MLPLIILCKQSKCGFRQIGGALCRNTNPALPLFRVKLVVADGNRYSASFLFMCSQLSSDLLHQLQHDTPDFGVILQILHGRYPVPNALYWGCNRFAKAQDCQVPLLPTQFNHRL